MATINDSERLAANSLLRRKEVLRIFRKDSGCDFSILEKYPPSERERLVEVKARMFTELQQEELANYYGLSQGPPILIVVEDGRIFRFVLDSVEEGKWDRNPSAYYDHPDVISKSELIQRQIDEFLYEYRHLPVDKLASLLDKSPDYVRDRIDQIDEIISKEGKPKCEILICAKCGKPWTQEVTRRPKPTVCGFC